MLRTIITKFAVLASALVLLALRTSLAPAVELEPGYYVDGNQFSAWYKPLVKPPTGWIENEEWTQRYERLVLFENGDMSRDKPIMYVRAHLADDMPLDLYIKGAQKGWLKRLKDSTVEPLPDLERPGKPLIKMFLYKNPSQADQAFELTAFVKDCDTKKPANTVFLQVVMAAPSMAEIERARPAFLELLHSL